MITASLHLEIFLAVLTAFQIILAIWSYRRTNSILLAIMVAFLPLVGIPFLLYLERKRIRDNHVAGALTYLTLTVSALAFLFFSREETPWALIHTMLFFAFLGMANLVATELKE